MHGFLTSPLKAWCGDSSSYYWSTSNTLVSTLSNLLQLANGLQFKQKLIHLGKLDQNLLIICGSFL